jgi:molecular chaperone GrpE
MSMTSANDNEAELAAGRAGGPGAQSAAEASRVDHRGEAAGGSAVEPVAGGAVEPDAAMLAREAAEMLAKEAAELKDRLLRSLAEMENLRRRTDREVADARAYALTSFARDLVGVADNMRRALDAANDGRAFAEGPAKALREGVELTERELLKVLEKHGVKRFDPQGMRFDPNLHQAMFEVPDTTVPSGSVAQVIQPGYMIADRVLRPALVGVSKGGPRTAPPQQPADEKQAG